jgi:hypothetical protein
VAVTALVLAAAPGAAQGAAWSRPVVLDRQPSFVQGVAVGFDRGGRGLAAWAVRGGLVTAARSPGGRWTKHGLAAPDLGHPSLVVDDAGRALVAGLLERGRSAFDDVPGVSRGGVFGGFGPPLALTPGRRGRYTGREAALAGNRRGDAIVAWTRYPYDPEGSGCERCYEVFARVRRAGGDFGPAVRVASRQTLGDLEVALNASGRGVVAWADRPQGSSPVRMRMLSPGGRWGGLEELPDVLPDRSAFFDSPSDLAAAISGRGRVFLAWSTIGYGMGDESDIGLPVYMTWRGLRPGLAPVRALSPSSAVDADGLSPLDATFVSGERAVVAWTEESGERAAVRAAVVRDGEVVSTRRLSDGARDARVADVAARADGRAVAMWTTRNAQDDFDIWEPTLLQASLFTGRGFGAAKPVSRAADTGVIAESEAAFDGGGRAVAIWARLPRSDKPGSSVLTSARRVR